MMRGHWRCWQKWARVAATVAALAAAILVAAVAQAADATAYPSRPIRLIVVFSPGGVADILARTIGEKLEASFGQPVVIENRPGASGNIAADMVARAAPDGHTLLVGATSLAILPVTQPTRAVDPLRALAPVTRLATQPILVAVNPALGVDSLGELIARARAAPGQIAYASAGVGTADHLSAALLAMRANVQLVHVPYANSGAEIKDLLNGEVKVAFITVGAVRALLATGQLKGLAVTGRQRIAVYPEVPTIAESGYPGFEVTSWYGVLAPAGTPRTIIDRIGGEIARIMQLPELREKCAAMGCEPAPTTPDEFAADIAALMKQWPPIVKAAGIPVE